LKLTELYEIRFGFELADVTQEWLAVLSCCFVFCNVCFLIDPYAVLVTWLMALASGTFSVTLPEPWVTTGYPLSSISIARIAVTSLSYSQQSGGPVLPHFFGLP